MLGGGYTSVHVLEASTSSETAISTRTNMVYTSPLGSYPRFRSEATYANCA